MSPDGKEKIFSGDNFINNVSMLKKYMAMARSNMLAEIDASKSKVLGTPLAYQPSNITERKYRKQQIRINEDSLITINLKPEYVTLGKPIKLFKSDISHPRFEELKRISTPIKSTTYIDQVTALAKTDIFKEKIKPKPKTKVIYNVKIIHLSTSDKSIRGHLFNSVEKIFVTRPSPKTGIAKKPPNYANQSHYEIINPSKTPGLIDYITKMRGGTKID
jgi:hypothetical protein